MAGATQPEQPQMSLFGPLRSIVIPEDLGMDEAEISRALLAWKFKLTPEEIETLELIIDDLTNDQITEKLGFESVNTTKDHIQRIYSKLQVRSRIQAVRVAVKNGLRPRPASPEHPNG